LPSIVEAVDGRCEVLFDGGVRCGQDILKGVALGAQAAMTGRAFLYGLGAGGRRGVTQALEILSRELQVSLALTGSNDVRDAGPGILLR
jgi:L-lactate dehydrogenase (cytochrome)